MTQDPVQDVRLGGGGDPSPPDTSRIEREIHAHLAEAIDIDQEKRYWAVLAALGRRDGRAAP